jgi:hypothetical protein
VRLTPKNPEPQAPTSTKLNRSSRLKLIARNVKERDTAPNTDSGYLQFIGLNVIRKLESASQETKVTGIPEMKGIPASLIGRCAASHDGEQFPPHTSAQPPNIRVEVGRGFVNSHALLTLFARALSST